MEEKEIEKTKRVNPFLEQYKTPHETVPFDKIKLEDYEEAFLEGIRRDDEQIEKTINNPAEPTFDNTIINVDDDKDGYYDLLSRVSTVFFNLLSAETNDEMDALAQKMQPILTKHANDVRLNKKLFERIKAVHDNHRELPVEVDSLKATMQDPTINHYKVIGLAGDWATTSELGDFNVEFVVPSKAKDLLAAMFGNDAVSDLTKVTLKTGDTDLDATTGFTGVALEPKKFKIQGTIAIVDDNNALYRQIRFSFRRHIPTYYQIPQDLSMD